MALITADWVRMMDRYNRWQNNNMGLAMASLPLEALLEERGAFFGSILRTANHLIWADTIWMARFDGGPKPDASSFDAMSLYGTHTDWATVREPLDQRISKWANTVTDADLAEDLDWYSGMQDRDITLELGRCVTHFFNHQTHHRGQIHAMLTNAGAKTEDTDLTFMPEGM